MVAAYLAGALPQRRTGVGWRSLTDLPAPAAEPTLTVAGRRRGLRGAGRGCRAPARRPSAAGCSTRCSAPRPPTSRAAPRSGHRRGAQGALEGVLVEGDRGRVGVAVRRRAPRGDAGRLRAVAARAAADRRRPTRWPRSGWRWAGRCSRCWPAAPPTSPRRCEVTGLPCRRRRQARRHPDPGAPHGDEVAVCVPQPGRARPAGCPRWSTLVADLPADALVLDGEALAWSTTTGRPRPFQETASRLDDRDRESRLALTPYFFDVLHLDGRDLLDAPAAERLDGARRAGARALPGAALRPATAEEAAAFQSPRPRRRPRGRRGQGARRALRGRPARRRLGQGQAAAHPRPGGAGRRVGQRPPRRAGSPTSTSAPATRRRRLRDAGQDLQGHDRRDARLADRALPRAARPPATGYVVHVRPEQVVEIAFDGVQRSTRYPGGVALRFARVLRYRDDKRADEADTIDTVRSLAWPRAARNHKCSRLGDTCCQRRHGHGAWRGRPSEPVGDSRVTGSAQPAMTIAGVHSVTSTDRQHGHAATDAAVPLRTPPGT